MDYNTNLTNSLFGIDELTSQRTEKECPVIGCTKDTELIGKSTICNAHGLEIHKSTFIYYNGDNREDKKKASLRNLLPFGRDFASNYIIGNKNKAESGRLGSENSEDALTWNIFGGLLWNNKLHHFYNHLTDTNTSCNQLKLFLWGLEVDFKNQRAVLWETLKKVRKCFERDINSFYTEPDIMILGPTHLVSIEAKFTSGNPIAENEKPDKEGKTPNSRKGLIERYVRPIQIDDKLIHPVMKPDEVGEKVHSQLLRMLIFTGAIAQLEDHRNWLVANLISKTQWSKKNNNSRGKDFNDPTSLIPASVRNNFKFISWEDDIYEKVLKNDPDLVELSKYMKNKTANLQKAFEI